jgi:L-lactate dehydrogenase complex protein LldG
MGSREKILQSIRDHRLEAVERPSLKGEWITYEDPRRQFAESVEAVGGRCVRVADRDGLNSALEALPEYASAEQVCSLVPGAGDSNVELTEIDDPHELESVEFAILPAEFGVAENGALWVTGDGLRHRVLYFIVQHLALVCRTEAIVHNMHEAYTRIAAAEESAGQSEAFARPGFGTFLSGPSKTADVEQSLVIGAHGPRSLTVFLMDE